MKSFRNNYADFWQFFVELHNPKLFSLAFNKQTSFEKKAPEIFWFCKLDKNQTTFWKT